MHNYIDIIVAAYMLDYPDHAAGDIAANLSVSKPTVERAIRRLRTEHKVDITYSGGGYHIEKLRQLIISALELRDSIDTILASHSASEADKAQGKGKNKCK